MLVACPKLFWLCLMHIWARHTIRHRTTVVLLTSLAKFVIKNNAHGKINEKECGGESDEKQCALNEKE